MSTQIFNKLRPAIIFLRRTKTTSAQYVSLRARDPTFEKLMEKHKNLLKVIAIQDLILASNSDPPSVSLDFLRRLSLRLHLNRGPTCFLRNYPHVFNIFNHPAKLHPFCAFTPAALQIVRLESEAIDNSLPLSVTRLVKLLSMSLTKTLPLRVIFKVWRELGMPDNFEDSVILRNSEVFSLRDENEPNTHLLVLNDSSEEFKDCIVASAEKRRVIVCCKEDCKSDLMYGLKQGFPSGMRLRKGFKAKVKERRRLPYLGVYEGMLEVKRTKIGKNENGKTGSWDHARVLELDRSHNKKIVLGSDFYARFLFLDHPGMFYLSTKGHMHTVFLRGGYERGCLKETSLVYEAWKNLFDLILMGRRVLDRDGNEFGI